MLRHGSPGDVTRPEANLRGEGTNIRNAVVQPAAGPTLRGAGADPVAMANATAGLRDQPGGDAIDVIILACTHFPLLQHELQEAAGPEVCLIDGAAGIARRIAHLTQGQAWPDTPQPGIAVFTRSDDRPPPPLAALAPYGIGSVETI